MQELQPRVSPSPALREVGNNSEWRISRFAQNPGWQSDVRVKASAEAYRFKCQGRRVVI